MKVFITGANGFIGRAVEDFYRTRGDVTAGVDLRDDEARGIVAGDITRPGSWQQSLAGSDLVIHTAAIVSNAAPMAAQWSVGAMGTRVVLDAAIAAGVPRFVHLSSVRAFSDVLFPSDVTERWPVRPDGNPYVDSKIAAEHVALAAHAAGEISVTVVRPGDVYGPGSVPWTILPIQMMSRNLFLLPARGRGVFSPVYIDDLVSGIELAGSRAAAHGQVFTIGGAAGVPCEEFFGCYATMLGKRLILVPTSVALAGASAVSAVSRLIRSQTEANTATVRYLTRTGTYSIEKARLMLSYEPAIDVPEGMRRIEMWLNSGGVSGVSLRSRA